MHYLNDIAYGFTGLLTGFLCFRCCRRWRAKFPAFTAYQLFNLVAYAALYLAFYHGTAASYSQLYWIHRVLGGFFLVLAAGEVAGHRYAGLVAGLALALAQAPLFRIWLDNAATIAVCLPLLVLLWTRSEKRASWWIAAGLATWGLTITLLAYNWRHPEYAFLGTYTYLLAQALWIVGSFQKEEAGA